ncbi:AzlD domain-containing protein [Azospirillaceae bacterium]
MTSPWLVLAVAGLVTYLSRALGVLVSGRINPNGPVFEWVACLAYALLAALVARMIVLPLGALQAVPLAGRLGAAAAALITYFVCRRSIPLGVLAGIGTLMLVILGQQALS